MYIRVLICFYLYQMWINYNFNRLLGNFDYL